MEGGRQDQASGIFLATAQKAQGSEHTGDFRKYENITYHGVSVAAILDTYNSAMVQENPLFSGEMNYLANKMLSLGVKDIKQPFPEESPMLIDKVSTGLCIIKIENIY